MFQKIIKSVLSSLVLLSTMSFAVQVELRNYNMTPAPLSVLEEHGEGAIVFDFLETENYEDVPHLVNGYVNTEIEITLTKIRVKDNNTSLITGEMLNYFDVSIESDGTLFFAQKVDIPKGTNASIYIPIEVTANSVQTDNERNGYIANLSCISDTTTPDISQYTYTKESNNTTIPDYEVALDLAPNVVSGDSNEVTLMLQVTEYNHGVNSGDLVVTINKSNNFTLDFDATMTTLNNVTLSNSEWTLEETGVKYKFVYTANGRKYPSYERKVIGLKGTYVAPSNQKGKFIFTTTIDNGSGDTDSSNNEDSDTLSYSNIK